MTESGSTFAHLELVRRIASGGMGEVWEARHLGPHQFRKRLAVKKILPHLVEDSDFVHMFLDEGRLVAQLEHPNICQIFRMGEAENTYYMEMEFVDGVVLTELIDKASRRGLLPDFDWHLCRVGLCPHEDRRSRSSIGDHSPRYFASECDVESGGLCQDLGFWDCEGPESFAKHFAWVAQGKVRLRVS